MIRRAPFIERFVLPLVEGGELHVSAPLGFGGLSRLADEPDDSAAERRLGEARLAVCAELLPEPVTPTLDEDSLRLAIALHDLLFLFHPDAPASMQGTSHRHVATGCALLAALELPDDPRDLVARHTLLHQLADLSRHDVRITFWAGRREFHGQNPPARLTAWRSLRRVTEERFTVPCLAELAGDPLGGGEAVRTLLAASPVTNLLDPLRGEPYFELRGGADDDVLPVAPGVCAVLGDASLCRLVVNHWLELGIERTGAAFAQALLGCLGRRRDDSLYPRLLMLLGHLHLCVVVAGPAARAELLRTATHSSPGLRDFCALFAALWHTAPRLATPPDLPRNAALFHAAAEHQRACAEIVAADRLAELRGLIARSIDSAGEVAA